MWWDPYAGSPEVLSPQNHYQPGRVAVSRAAMRNVGWLITDTLQDGGGDQSSMRGARESHDDTQLSPWTHPASLIMEQKI